MQANINSAFSLQLLFLGCINLSNYLLRREYKKTWHTTVIQIFTARYMPILRSKTSFIPKLKIKRGRL